MLHVCSVSSGHIIHGIFLFNFVTFVFFLLCTWFVLLCLLLFFLESLILIFIALSLIMVWFSYSEQGLAVKLLSIANHPVSSLLFTFKKETTDTCVFGPQNVGYVLGVPLFFF